MFVAARRFSLAAERGTFPVVCRLLIVEASLVAEHGLQNMWASVLVAQELSCSMGVWDLPGQGGGACVPYIGRWILNPWTTKGKFQRFTFQRDKEGIYKFLK